MIETHRDPGLLGRNAVVEALSHRRRRRVLRLLLPAGALHVEDVVGSVAAMGPDGPAAGGDPAAVRIDLRHHHLPKLVTAGLVERDGDRLRARREAREDPLLADLLAVESEDWDDVLACIADARRRAVLGALAERDGAVDVPALAFAVVDRLDDRDRSAVDDLVRELHHVHLPKLEAAGLVAREDCGRSVRYLGHPDLDSVVADRRDVEGRRLGVPH